MSKIGDTVWLEKAQSDIVYDSVKWEVISGYHRVSKLHFDLVADFYPITYVEFDAEYAYWHDTSPTELNKVIILHEYRGSDMVEVKVEENK